MTETNLKEQYGVIKNKTKDIALRYRTKGDVVVWDQHIEERLANFKPTLMVYGVYNAGKSTLLNALFGKEELAKTADVPETAIVTPYEYHGFTIYDTPGINAPKEHEEVTEAHRKKCEMILFVMSNDGAFEQEYIYLKIAEILKEKKPLLIVVNNKTGIDIASAQVQAEIDKINAHLTTICDREGIAKAEEKVDIVYVDALTALEGKIENEPELIEESNIELLEQKIDQMLGRSGRAEVVQALNVFIAQFVNDTIEMIDAKIENPEVQKTEELITYFEKLKQKTKLEMIAMSEDYLAIVKGRLLELMLERDQEGLSLFITETTNQINARVEQIVHSAQEEIKKHIDTYEAEVSSINALDIAYQEEAIDEMEEESDFGKEMVAAIGTATTIIPEVVPVYGIPIPARKIAQVCVALFGAFSASKEARLKAEAKAEAKRKQYLSAKNQTDAFVLQFKQQLLQNIDQNIANVFDKVIGDFVKLSHSLQTEKTQLLEDKQQLQHIVDTLS